MSFYKLLVAKLSPEKRPPVGTDWVGYEALIGFIQENGILSVPGDIVEVGTFLGGGAYKMSNFLERMGSSKRLFVVDVFDPTFDCTVNRSRKDMKTLYTKALKKYKGQSQFSVFSMVTEGCKNLVVLSSDSKNVKIPSDQFCFAFIDGNHSPEYVENDFYLVWNKLSSGGCVSFHDYGGDLPQTTARIDALLLRHKVEVKSTFKLSKKTLLFIIKK